MNKKVQKRKQSCIVAGLLGWLLLAGVSAASGQQTTAPEAQKVTIHADELNIDSDNRRAVFQGNVRATVQGMRFSCQHMEVSYTADGALQTLVASGKVQIKKGDILATADKASLIKSTKTLHLRGNPMVKRGSNMLKGAQVSIQLATGEIRVTQARGVFELRQ